jgi:hypothetical protein
MNDKIYASESTVYNAFVDMCVPEKPLPSAMATSPIASTVYELLLTVLTITKTFQHISMVGDSRVSPLVRNLTNSLDS